MRSFLNSHLHGSEAVHYTVCRGYFSFLCYFQSKERRIKWFLQREGEQIKEWMNRSMNKTFVEEQKYACYLASWSAIIFLPCRGYSVSLFLGLDPNLTDVALALQAEPQSTNILHLSLLHQNSKRENCSASHKLFLWCRGEGKGFATNNVYGLCFCRVICINFFPICGGFTADTDWSRTEPVQNISENCILVNFGPSAF